VLFHYLCIDIHHQKLFSQCLSLYILVMHVSQSLLLYRNSILYLLLPLSFQIPNRNHANQSSHCNYINLYKVLSNILVSDSSMTLFISFKSLDCLTVCITTQFCTTHFLRVYAQIPHPRFPTCHS
jgi:hypothetical protein